MKTKQLQKICSKGTKKAVWKASVVKLCRFSGKLLVFWVALLLLVTLTLSSPILAANEQQEQGVIRETLSNKLKVVIVPHPLGSVVTTVVTYLVGSNEDPEGYSGMAHAEEHMMRRESWKGLSADQLADITAFMGDIKNADTTQTRTRFYFHVPAEYLDVVLQIEAIRMRGDLEKDSDIEGLWQQEQGVIGNELAQYLNGEYFVRGKLLGKMFSGTPYSLESQGTPEALNKITGDMLKKFHDKWYVPNNAILLILGNVQPEKTFELVRRYFEGIPAKELPKRPVVQVQPVKPFEQEPTHFSKFLATLAFRMPGYDNPDYAASQVLSDILDRKFKNPCDLVSEEKAPSINFRLYPLPKTGLGYVIADFHKGGSVKEGKELIKKIKQILAEDIKKGFSPDLVEAAKRRERLDAEIQKNWGYDLAMLWSEVLAVEGRKSPEEDDKAIEAVEPYDVNRVAQKYLDFDHAIEVFFTPEVLGKPTFFKGFGGKKSLALQQTRTDKLPNWAEKVKRLAIPPPTLMQPEETTLSNGMRLIVQTVSVSDTISLYCHVEPNLQVPKEHEGVEQILKEFFSYGTETLDCQKFQNALDEIGANETAGTDLFSLQVLTDHFDRGLQLLADNMRHPVFSERDFEKIKKKVADTMENPRKKTLLEVQKKLLTALLPKNDPVRPPETAQIPVLGLNVKDVKDYYEKSFRPDLTTIVVIGNVTSERAKAVIENHFGNWESKGPKPDTLLPPVPLNKRSPPLHVPDPFQLQDEVILAENIDLKRSNPDYYALILGNCILGGGYYTSKLHQDLRDKMALVYSVSTKFDIGRTRGIFQVNYRCFPEKVKQSVDIVIKNLQEMQRSLDSNQLEKAKAELLCNEIYFKESRIEKIAQGFIQRVILDLPLNEPRQAAPRYLEFNADQVRSAFLKYLRPHDLVLITRGPNPSQ